jgi:hypothetical protein
MKKTAILFSSALFYKLVFVPIFTQTPASGQGLFFEGMLYDLNMLAIAILAITIPILAVKVIKQIK